MEGTEAGVGAAVRGFVRHAKELVPYSVSRREL